MTADLLEGLARAYEPRQRTYPSPLALARHLDPRTNRTDALDLIDRSLVELAEATDHDALMVMIPPQEGKSWTVARRLPEWLLQDNPGLRIAIVSYEAETALRWGRDIKQDIALAGGELAISLREDSQAAGRWETPDGGGVYSVGVGGALTGRPTDWLVVDDPVKDRAAAESATVRRTTWDWWESVALTRLAPGARVVLVLTRWHEDDLAGRILAMPGPLRWKVLTIPAIAVGADDPLGREPGEELVSVRGRAPGYFRHLRATMSPYVFSSIYQQNPTAAEGNFFRRPTFRYWRTAPAWSDGRERIDCEGRLTTLADCWRFATADVAASTKTSADYTVIAYWCVTPEGDLVLLDRARAQVDQHDHFGLATPLLARWGECQIFVERHFFATTLIRDAEDRGVPIAELVADSDKITRAVPAAGRIHAGRVWFPAVPETGWSIDEWCDELASFPTGSNDDQVDVLAYAVRVQMMNWTPAKTPPRPGLSPHERAVAEAARSATGNGQIDLMNTPW
jgi:predicted phage terminase large subunit-like protein